MGIQRDARLHECPSCEALMDYRFTRADGDMAVRSCVGCGHEVTEVLLQDCPLSEATHFNKSI